VAEIANTLSFPELFLILRRAAARRAEAYQVMATAQILAACAPWSKDAAKKAERFVKSLAPAEKQNPRDAGNELLKMFAKAGIPVVKG